MRLNLACLSMSLAAVVTAEPQDGPERSYQDPTSTSIIIEEQTITRISTVTIGLLPGVTFTAFDTSILPVEEPSVCTASDRRRNAYLPAEEAAQSSLYYHYRNPHIAPRPTPVPICNGPTSTITLTSTQITLLEQTSTTSLPTPATQATTILTSIITSTSTPTSNPCPTIPATNTQTNYTTEYILYSQTCGRTLSYSNPGNTNPPVTLPIRARVLACEAASQCATAARNQGAGYPSFDLHYRVSQGWECVMFFGRNDDAEYWDVVDEDVGEGYGYSV